MAKTKISITVDIKSPLDVPLFMQAMENIAKHFSAAELMKVAKKLDQPIIRSQIKAML